MLLHVAADGDEQDGTTASASIQRLTTGQQQVLLSSYCIAAMDAAEISTFERLIACRAEHSVPQPPPSQPSPMGDLIIARLGKQ